MSQLFETLASPANLSGLSVFLRLLLAVLFGGAIGLERGHKRRAAGFRTYILVTLGSTIAMLSDLYLLKTINQNADPARFGAQVVAGVGIICAGTIMVTNNKQVKGLTTAAGLWATACLGLAIGAGFYEVAIVGFVIILTAMSFFQRLEKDVVANSQRIDLYIEIIGIHNMSDMVTHIKSLNAKLDNLEFNQTGNVSGADVSLLVSLKFPEKFSHNAFIEDLSEHEGVLFVEEL